MAITLGNVQKGSAVAVVTWGDETAEVNFNPGAYTPVVEEQAQAAFERSRPGQALAELLENLIQSWDVMDGDNEVPHDVETLREMPVDFLSSVMQAISKVTSDLREERKNSEGGSRRKGKTAFGRHGTR